MITLGEQKESTVAEGSRNNATSNGQNTMEERRSLSTCVNTFDPMK